MKHRPCRIKMAGVSPTPSYADAATKLFYSLVKAVRDEFIRDARDPMNFEGEVRLDWNFNNDERVFSVLRSNVLERDFLQHPMTWIYEALHFCAETDFWYHNEKQWDDGYLGGEG